MTTTQEAPVELESGHQMPMDPGDVSYLEAEGEDTWVHLAAAERLRVQRPLAEVATIFAPPRLPAHPASCRAAVAPLHR